MGRKSKRIVAILLSLLMVFSVCSPITGGGGLGSSRAKAGNTEQTATATDAITYGKSGSPVKTYANPEGLTLSDFTITVNGQKVTNDSAVKNGDEVQIKFNWAIANNSHVSEFEVDLKAQGITVNDYQESVLYDSSSRAVGTWKIENGRFYITLDSQFTAESNIDGGGNIKGRVDFSADDLDENNKGKFEIGDASFTIDVDLNQTESSAWAWKNAGTATVNDDGTVTQSYSLGVEAQNGTVTLGEATETLGTALGQMSNIKVGGTSYSTWEEAKAALNGMKLDSTSEDTKRVEITYDVNISAENAKQAFKNGNTTIFNNQFNIDYKTSKDNPKDAGASTTGINIARPSVSKNGAWNTDASGNKETVTWTITVTLGDLTKFSDFDADSVKIADALGEYLTAADLPAGVDLSNLTLQDFTESNGTYIFSYTTSVADEALNSTFPVTLTNKADVDFGDDITYGSSASVTTDGTGIIEKEFDHINEDGTLAWKVFIHVPESDTITEVVLGDWDNPTYPFTQTMDTTVVVDGSTVFDNGTWISNTMVSNSSRAESGNIELRFNDEYVASKKGATIEIAVSTKPQNLSDGAIYRNHANLSYKDASGNSYTKSTDATYEYTNSLNKTGKVSTEKLNTVEYTLDVNLSSVASLSAGDSITVVDTLPENMVFNADGVLNYRKWVNDYYSYDDTSLTGELGVAIENNKVTFTIPVSSAVLSAVEEAASGSAGYTKVFARIIYTASLSDDALKDYVAEGKEIEVTNNAEVLYDGDVIGKDSSTNKLTPEKMVTKGGTYNVEKKAAEYTIYVNPNAADLSDADIIAAEDTFGEALIFRKDTLKIQEYTGSKNPLQDSQNWKDLSNYSYTYDSDTRTLKLSLPDSKALKITYEAYINQEIGGALNAANSTNSFRLVGYTGNDDSSSTNFSTTVQEPSVWAHSDTGSITLYKYWTNENNQLVALNGSTFALYECKRDGTNSWTQELEEEPVKKGITLDGTGTVIIKELAYDKVYALVETGADDGFQINKEPYYFMICDTGSTATVPEWADKYFYSGFLYYENEPDTQERGSLTISKKVEGYTFAAGKTFDVTVKDADGNYVDKDGNVSTDKAVIEIPAGGSVTINNIPVGDYTVSEETEGTAVAGYDLEVTVNNEGKVTITKDTTATAEVTNTYTQDKGSLTISKKVEGYTFAEGKTFDVTVTNAAGKYVSADGVFSDTKVTIAVPANGNITIKDIPVGTYTVSEDQAGAAVTNYGLVVSGEGDVVVTKDATATAAITNTYTQDKGSLTISKTVTGYTFAAGKTFDVTVTNAAGKYVSADGAFSDTKVTIAVPANGSVTIKDIPVGTYTVSEGQAGAAVTNYGLVVSGEGDVTVTKDTTATAAITNTYTQDKGSLTISKKVEGYTFASGKTFDVTVTNAAGKYVDKDGNISDTKVTIAVPANGDVTINDIPVGTYTVSEDQAGAAVTNYGLVVSGEGDVTVTKDATATAEVTNTYTQDKGSLAISKKVEGYTFAAGKTFDVTVTNAAGKYVSAEGAFSDTKVTIAVPANGSVSINDIPVGTYTVSENQAGAAVTNYGLVVSGEGDVTVTKDATATAAITNTYTQDKGSLTISKKVEGYTFASGKTFDVTVTNAAGKYVDKDGNISDTKVTIAVPANGDVTINDIPVGTYTVSEDQAGAAVTNYGLVVSGEGDVTVTKDATATAEVTNTYTQDKGSLAISKKVEGYTFAAGKTFDVTVTNAAGKYVSADGAFSDTKVTIAVPANGSVTIKDIPVGTYTVSEDQAGAAVTNYGLVVSGEGDVTVTKDTTATAEVTNTYTQDKGSLAISKKVEGYTFAAGKTFDVTVTNAAGKYVSADGAFSDTKVTIAVPANGDVTINDIPVGTYTVSEDQTGAAVTNYGLVVSGEGEVTVTKDTTATAAITNTYTSRLGKIRFAKVGRINETCSADKDAVKALEGVVFALYEEDGTTAVTDAKGDAVTATSNSNGIVEFTGLAIGTYVVKEVSSVENYIVDTNSYKATITAENVDTYAALEDVTDNKLVNDKHRTDISLVKVNESDTSEKLPDATYGLYKTENNVEVEVATAKTDSDGVLTFTGVFTDTEYTIKELVSPNGSYVSENPIKIEYGVKEDGTIEIKNFDGGVNTENGSATAVVKDGQITWLEPSVKYSFVKENEAGEKLAGAVLKIVDSEGNEVAKWTTDGNAYELNGTLSVGNTYKLVEVSAPSGYELAADIEFTVANEAVSAGENKVVTITMVDKASEVTTEDTTEVTTEDTTEVTTEDTTEVTTEDTSEVTTEDTSEVTTEDTGDTTEDTGDTTEDTGDTTEVITTEQTPKTPSDTPQTGDQAPIMPIVILFTMSVAGIVVVVVAKRKNNKQNREN